MMGQGKASLSAAETASKFFMWSLDDCVPLYGVNDLLGVICVFLLLAGQRLVSVLFSPPLISSFGLPINASVFWAR